MEEGQEDKEQNLHVGIMMTSLNAGGQNMINTLQKFGWNYTQLAKGLKWTGWQMRMKAYIDFANSISPDDLIVLIDGYDALCVRRPEGLVELFQSFNCDVLVGAENYCFVNCVNVDSYWERNEDVYGNRNVQGGFVMGKPMEIANMYQWCLDQNIKDDQMGIAMYMNAHPDDRIKLDAAQQIVYNDNFGDSGEIEILPSGHIQIKKDKITTEPFFIHFPGFLFKNDMLEFLSPLEKKKLPHYDKVGQHILGDDFIVIGQADKVAYIVHNFLFIFLIGLLVLIFFVFIGCKIHGRIKRTR